MSKLFSSVVGGIRRWITSALLWIYLVFTYRSRPLKPGPVFIRIYAKGANAMSKFAVLDLPPVLESDGVTKRVLRLSIDGNPLPLMILAGGALESDEFSVDHDMTLSGTLVDVDQAGNESLPTEFEFLIDITAPNKPGAVGLRLLSRPTTTEEPVTTTEEPVTTTEEPVTTIEEPVTTSGEDDTVDFEPTTTEEPVTTTDEAYNDGTIIDGSIDEDQF